MTSRRGASFGILERLVGVSPRSPQRAARRPLKLVGRDLARMPLRAGVRRRILPVVLASALISALGLAVLRIELIRLRYDLAAAMKSEKQLLDERMLRTAEVRRLRDPARLARLAAERGFVRPDRVIDLQEVDVAAGPRP
jgi:hypothetical protein